MFHGSIPALITPFRDGEVDRKAFADLVERQIAAGAGALVPVGTTGETSTLTHQEHRDTVSLCIEVAAGRIPVIAGAGSNSTAEAISLARHAKQAGADAALIVCPYYNRPDQRGLEAHYRAINDAVELPVFIYNVPKRTASDILPDTVGRLAQLPNIIGIKDATGDMERVYQHLDLIGEADFTLLSGDDPTALAFCAAGGKGCISVTANVVPEKTAAMYTAALSGDFDTAREIDAELFDLHKALFESPSPGPAKYALSKLGLCAPDLRLPLVGPDDAARKVIDAALERARI
ncbi:MAG: 4-hydroxy-tetrahydrodipicolinate synthase [Alphaproteobacteria bacterium]|jgi:4-hydroxy-tetrahydrodipicolinate synthase|nr:4-hydroxy-tetrahydrodipicolinate synthase [Alphaproteobacteria bacterium]